MLDFQAGPEEESVDHRRSPGQMMEQRDAARVDEAAAQLARRVRSSARRRVSRGLFHHGSHGLQLLMGRAREVLGAALAPAPLDHKH